MRHPGMANGEPRSSGPDPIALLDPAAGWLPLQADTGSLACLHSVPAPPAAKSAEPFGPLGPHGPQPEVRHRRHRAFGHGQHEGRRRAPKRAWASLRSRCPPASASSSTIAMCCCRLSPAGPLRIPYLYSAAGGALPRHRLACRVPRFLYPILAVFFSTMLAQYLQHSPRCRYKH